MTTHHRPPAHAAEPPTDIDTLSVAELQDRTAQALDHIAAIKALFPGLLQLEQDQRKGNAGASIGRMGTPLSKLFTLLTVTPLTDAQVAALTPDEQAARTTQEKLAAAFDTLGAQDDGVDPEHFEAALLNQRLVRTQTEQSIASALEDLARLFSDDALHTAETVVLPGHLALGLAKTIAAGNAAFRGLLAPVTDALRDMTAAAREARAAAKAAAAKTPPAPATPTK